MKGFPGATVQETISGSGEAHWDVGEEQVGVGRDGKPTREGKSECSGGDTEYSVGICRNERSSPGGGNRERMGWGGATVYLRTAKNKEDERNCGHE